MPNKYTMLLLSLLFLDVSSVSAQEEKKRFTIPDDVVCKVKSPQNIMFCIDTDGTPLTGEMAKYFEGALIRLYEIKDGVLDGLGQTYYTNGKIKTEIPYKEGLVNGTLKKYNRNGILSEEISYLNNKKEGVAKYYNDQGGLVIKMAYVNNQDMGDAFIYDGKHETPLYRLKNYLGTTLSGTYTYQSSKEELKTIAIPEIIIAGINHKCLNMQTELSSSPCAVVYKQNPNCDQKWRKANRQAVRAYLKTCGESNE